MEEIIQHVCPRQHTLLLKDDEIGHKYIRCKICRYAIEAPYYVCDRCKYYVHKSCEELPKQINFPLHPRHPLSLIRIRVSCDCCGEWPNKDLMFCCVECGFELDVECYEMSKAIRRGGEGQDCIQHFSHPHLLLLVHSSQALAKNINVRCFACQSEDGGVYYGCYRCKYFLHKQCIHQFPQQIQTSHHPNHDHLSLLMKRRNCKCCICGCDDRPALYFECPQCDFLLCLECGLRPTGTINYEDHPHPLSFMEKIRTTTIDQCNVYGTCLKLSAMSDCEEFKLTNSSIFGCLVCGFKLHFLCGPLPSLIKHESHLHNLHLVELLIEDVSGEYNCDICEQERNPRIRVYHCGECKFVAHAHCVLSEIRNVLKGDLTDLKLKILREDVWNSPQEIDQATLSPLTLRDLILKLTEKELRVLKDFVYWDDKDGKKEEEVSKIDEDNSTSEEEVRKVDEDSSTSEEEVSQIDEDSSTSEEEVSQVDEGSSTSEEELSKIDEDSLTSEEEVSQKTTQLKLKDDRFHEVIRFSTFTIDDFILFIFVDIGMKKLKIKSNDLALKVVDIKGYSIPLNLVSAMKYLLYKYGDISTISSQELKSKYSRELKSICFFFVCKVMKDMHTTLLIDITKDLLQQWFRCMIFAEELSFDIKFLKESLLNITKEFYFQQLRIVVDTDIPTFLDEKIAELQKKIAKLQKKKDKCRKFRESTSKKESIKKGLEGAMKAKWKLASQIGFDTSNTFGKYYIYRMINN